MKDAAIAVAAWAQHAVQALNVARCTRTLAASARLNVAKVAGVVNPVYPGTKLNGKVLPPAFSSASASSNSLEASCIASADVTSGAGSARIGRSTSIGSPVGPLRTAIL